MAWDLSRKDWEDRIRNGLSLMPDLALDKVESERAVAIFNKLRLPDVPGTPRLESAAGEWLREIVRALFGSFDLATEHRMVRELFLLIAKKNNKTTGFAAVMMTAALMNNRPRAEFLFVGTTQATSDLAFTQAVGMIEADDEAQRQENGKEGFLKRTMKVQDHLKRIVYYGQKGRPRGKSDDKNFVSQLGIKTFSEEILTGPRPSGVMVDELHLLGKDPKAAAVIGQLRGGMVSNPQAFIAFTTTQSDEPPAGVFLQELTRARMIRDGEIEGGNMLPILYEFPDDVIESEGWRDSKNWGMVNPNLNLSVFLHLLEADWAAAQIAGETEIRRWASQHLNIQIGVALKSNFWKGAKHWDKNADVEIAAAHAALIKAKADREAKKAARLAELADLLASCEVVTIGADGGGLDDLFGLFVLGREAGSERMEKRRWRCWAHAWAHDSVFEERKDIAARLRDFEQDGDLTVCYEPGDDSVEIAAIIMQAEEASLLPEKCAVGVDQVGIAGAIEELGRFGFDITMGVRVIGIPQGWKLNGAIKEMERQLKAGRVKHNGSRLMNWCLGNAKTTPRGNAVSIEKQTSGNAKIDPLMAGFNAVALMTLNPEPQISVFDRLAAEDGHADDTSMQQDDIDMSILNDMTHPRFAEMRDKFNARLAAHDEEEFV